MKITVVYGPPCSGKSTYARDALTDESVLYDYDALILAMTNREKHIRAKSAAHTLVVKARSTFIKYLEETGADAAFIITSFPSDGLKKALAGFDEVEYIMMETPLDECLARLADDDMRPDKDEWEKVIRAWFDAHGQERSAEITRAEVRRMLQ